MGGCPADVLEWFEDMGLMRRVAALKKNASVAAADAVIVAEAVHHYYPKMVQLHSYVEQNNTPGRVSNWKHLNTKVLKPIHCDLSEDQIMRFASRQSEREVVEYLRELRIRLPSFEPLYLAEFHVSNDAASQKMSVARMMRPPPQRSHSIASDDSSVLTDCTYETSSVASSVASSVPHRAGPVSPSAQPMGTNLHRQSSSAPSQAGGTPKSAHVRRPSAAQSNKLLERRKAKEEASRRASLMSTNDIEAQFQMLSGKIRRQTVSIAAETDELDRRSQTLDAQMAALQRQNQQELTKIEKRLSVLRLEQLEAETGQSVAISDDVNYSAMVDPGKNSFARELSAALKESAMEASSLDAARGVVRSSPPKARSDSVASALFGAKEARTNIPFGGSPAPAPAARAAGGKAEYESGEEGSYEDEEGSSMYSEDESGSEYETDDSDEPPPPPPPRPKPDPNTNSSTSNGKSHSVVVKAAMTVSELREPAPPPAPAAPARGAISTAEDHAKHQQLHAHFAAQQEQDEREGEDEEDSDEEAAFAALASMRQASASLRAGSPGTAAAAPGVPAAAASVKLAAAASPTPVAKRAPSEKDQDPSHRRCYDKKKQRFYYVDLKTGESKWRAPTEGVVLCTDKENREYYFDVVTEKSTWVKR